MAGLHGVDLFLICWFASFVPSSLSSHLPSLLGPLPSSTLFPLTSLYSPYLHSRFAHTHKLFVLLGYKRITTMCRKTISFLISLSSPSRLSYISHLSPFFLSLSLSLLFFRLCQITPVSSSVLYSISPNLFNQCSNSPLSLSLSLPTNDPFSLSLFFHYTIRILAHMFNAIPGLRESPVYNFDSFSPCHLSPSPHPSLLTFLLIPHSISSSLFAS